jgi:hypothetical protein
MLIAPVVVKVKLLVVLELSRTLKMAPLGVAVVNGCAHAARVKAPPKDSGATEM